MKHRGKYTPDANYSPTERFPREKTAPHLQKPRRAAREKTEYNKLSLIISVKNRFVNPVFPFFFRIFFPYLTACRHGAAGKLLENRFHLACFVKRRKGKQRRQRGAQCRFQ